MKPKRVYVIAGTYKQFRYYYPKPDKNIIYVNSVDQLHGQHGGTVDRVGTWYTRPDLEDLEREVAYMLFKGSRE